jgi:hypothetical protein
MGRVKTVNPELPPYMDFFHGAYYYRGRGNGRRRIHLGTDKRLALTRYRNLCRGLTEDDSKALAGEQFVYVISRFGVDSPVKIGITQSLAQRLSRLQTANAEPLQVRASYLFTSVRAGAFLVTARHFDHNAWKRRVCKSLNLVGRAGLEPATNGLKAHASILAIALS